MRVVVVETVVAQDPCRLPARGYRGQQHTMVRGVFSGPVARRRPPSVSSPASPSGLVGLPCACRSAGSILPDTLWEIMIPTDPDTVALRRPLAVSIDDNLDLFDRPEYGEDD